MSRPLSVIVMGLGNRGSKYAKLMSVDPEHYNVVGVAEPDHARRDEIQEIFGLSDDVCFDSWDEILAVNVFNKNLILFSCRKNKLKVRHVFSQHRPFLSHIDNLSLPLWIQRMVIKEATHFV